MYEPRPGMREMPPIQEMKKCAGTVTLTEDQAAECRVLLRGEGDSEERDQLACELEEGHAKLHWAEFNASGDDEVWLTWDDGHLSIRYLSADAHCPFEGGREFDVCNLPEGHEGSHKILSYFWRAVPADAT